MEIGIGAYHVHPLARAMGADEYRRLAAGRLAQCRLHGRIERAEK